MAEHHDVPHLSSLIQRLAIVVLNRDRFDVLAKAAQPDLWIGGRAAAACVEDEDSSSGVNALDVDERLLVVDVLVFGEHEGRGC